MKSSNSLLGGLFMVLAGLLFAITNTSVQYLSSTIDPSAIAFFQYALAFIFIIPFLGIRGSKKAINSKHRLLHFVRVAFSVFGVQLWTYGLAYVPIWQAIALVMLSPLFTTIGSGLFLKENVSKIRYIATLIGLLGGFIILSPWSDDFNIYAFLPIAAAVFWSFASLITKYTSKDDNPITIVAYLLVLLLPVNYLFGYSHILMPSDLSTWGILILLGAVTAMAQFAIAKSYNLADASFVQPFDHLKLPFNVLAGWLVFGYLPPGELWIGAALIIFAVTMVSRVEKYKKEIDISN
ncbi:DMT family transporter [Pasteurella skyensis]|uniref:DMT family transporter n=1 Tax=Phocoenobacter skyensis TaxID=97481 RepID=A0AAJ6NZV1_9PAST|nr:DMT family transporter [Pasteurella skyensis]MDP8161851.1 DMT family transporter [Pasteurella skyensis]MDP8172007.1 DMT family transporter [Pasteurella skyensis]MDP8176242.1 DMT family transporter [Pasteurella skyensis]MDP8178262.1 DMT family transporter [Pasteurella skyensis]MDP8182130.1 DMT family transporter [Pasteurella skyensis]